MTKSEILNLVYNPAAAKANAWKVDFYRKETFLKALEIYHTVSHTAAREFLNGETMKNYPRSYHKYSNVLDIAKKINDLYSDYDPYDFEEDMCPPEEIAHYIVNKDSVVLDDLNGMLENCDEGEEMFDRISDMIKEVSVYYR